MYTNYRPTPLQHYAFPAGGRGLSLVRSQPAACAHRGPCCVGSGPGAAQAGPGSTPVHRACTGPALLPELALPVHRWVPARAAPVAVQVMDESGCFKVENFKAMQEEAGHKAAEKAAGEAAATGNERGAGRESGRGRGRGGRCSPCRCEA